MKNLLILSLIFLFTGCTDKTITRIYLEKNSKKMTAGNIIFSSDIIGAVGDMTVKGDLIIFIDHHPSSATCFYVVNKTTGELENSFGKRGRGPEEYLQPTIVRNEKQYNQDNLLDVYDMGTNTANTLDLTNPKEICRILNSEIKAPNEVYGMKFINRIGDEIMGQVAIQTEDATWLKFVNINDAKVQNKIPYFNSELVIKTGASFIFDTHVYVSALSNKIITGMSFFDYINILNRKGELLKRYQFGETPLPQLDDKGTISKYIVYTHLSYSSPNYCYFLRYGTDMNRPDFDDTGMTLIKLDWNGNFVDSYSIEHFLYGFCVDEQNGVLYGVITNRETGTVSIREYKGL